MRGFKRTISILLSLLIILSVFTTAPFTVNAEQTTDLSPAYVAYQAKRYSDPNGQNLFGDASRTYAQTYYNQMKKDNKVISGITIWEAAHIATSPTYSLESGLITKKDMYKLAIFDMLDLSESDTFVSNLLDMVNDSRLSYIVSVSKSICDPNDINVSELKNFEVNAEYINFLKESAKLAKAFDVVDKISTIASGCKNLYEAILTTANYQAISDMKNGTKEVLSAIYADTSNPSELRQAAYECVNNFGDGFDRILNTVSTGSNLCLNATLETIFKEAVDSIWSEIISVIPGGKVVMTAAKGMRVLSNAVFAMDDTCRIYYQFEADVTLEQAVRNVMNNARCDYIQDNNQDKAIAYMRAVEMYKRIVLQGYDYTKEMLEIKANAPATKWFDWFNHDYSECMELMEGVESIKNNKQKLYKQFEDWVHSDYINLYCKDYNETINDFNNQQTIKTDSVTLTQIKDINVGDSGYIYDYIMKTCQPENSTEYKKCYFTAENKDAFTIDKLGSFVAESAGQVTLIYDKGGELESSVTITVGSSPTDNKHDYYSDFKYSTFYNNSQQRTEATITEYTGSQSNLIIPYSIDGYIVTSIGRRTFIGCTSLKSINIPDSVTNIDDSAFYGCTSLTSINIPDGVTSIGDWAFEGCTSLTSINIPDGVTCIGGWAFKGCSSLTSINIPDSVTNIGDSAFYGCTSLTSITIPDGITSIGDSTFRSCTSLTSINIPDSVKSIGNFTFSGCTNLTSINIPDGVTSIGGDAFSSCTSLTSITIPNSVTSIGDSAFYGCTNLTSINIPDGVTSIGYSAFYGCTSLTSINIPVDVTSIGDTTFYGCTSLTSVTVGNSVTSIGYSTFYGCTNLTSINIPDSLISIGSWAFDDCKSLTNITLPDSVISIGNYAFSGCSSLTSITIPDRVTHIDGVFIGCTSLTSINISSSVTNIGNSTFSFCTSLISIKIPDSVTSIGDSAFYGCTSLTSISIPDGITSIGDSAFDGCTNLTSINIPDSVKSIGNSTFSGCTNLTSINIPNSVTSIGDSTFYGCTSLTSIKIPNSVTSIGDSAFYGCTNLTSINIPDGVTSIGGGAFSSCTSLTSINIPDRVKSIGNFTFKSCTSLISIKIPDSVTSIGDSAFYCCTNLTSINIPDSLISIGSWAFDDCKSLTNITIPDSVISIGNYAFSGCSNLTSIKIPDSVTNIGDSAFYDCTSLSSVTVGNSVTSIGDSAFEGCTNLTSINIPDSVKSMGNFFTFRFCTSLTSINIPDGVTSIGDSTFSGCTNLTSINIPNSVTSIGDSAFSGCTSLTSINIPNSVTSIGDSAFDDCKSLTSINIPDGVTSIGYSAFYDCKSLTNITIPDGVTSIGNYAFSGCSSLTSIKIPNSVTSIGDAANYDLSDVLFMGSKEQWNSITMVSDNFSNAAIHYNAEYIKTVEPDCTNKGYDLYSCSECENGVKVNFTDALGHDFINGICERCGKDELDCIESAHPYENDTDEKWTIHKNNAKRIAVVFSDKTETESGSDYIYIYDKDNEEIGCYSGTELAGKRIVVQGDTVTIRLTSDSSNTCYGFDITDVKPYYEECVHSETELINVREAGCGWEGYTGDVRCVECQEILSYGKYIDATEEHSIISEIIPPTCGQEGYTHHYCENCDYSYDDNYVDATGNHEFENGICKICGQPDIDCLENFKANDTKNIEITNGGEFKYFKFTPNKNGTLNFYSVGTCDTYGCLFDSEMTELAYNDDGSEDYNFSITYDVIAGKTYILACRMYSSDTIGNFNTVLNFEPDDTALIGDVDGNGEVSIADATEIQKYLVQYVSFNEEQLKVSDTNGDGKVDIKDVTQIQKYIVQLISSLV